MSEPGQSPAPPAEENASDVGFTRRLKQAREKSGYTQAVLANRTKLIDIDRRGVSRTAIIAYEQGISKPGLREIRLICEVLHVTPNWLIYGSEAAARASLPSHEFISDGSSGVRSVMALALAILALKGHEKDSLLTLALSLAGRELGDSGLSSLMTWSILLDDEFKALLHSRFPAEFEGMPTANFAAWLAAHGVTTNFGNRFRLDEEGEIQNPEAAIYPSPGTKSR